MSGSDPVSAARRHWHGMAQLLLQALVVVAVACIWQWLVDQTVALLTAQHHASVHAAAACPTQRELMTSSCDMHDLAFVGRQDSNAKKEVTTEYIPTGQYK